jgi:hypothetical protein
MGSNGIVKKLIRGKIMSEEIKKVWWKSKTLWVNVIAMVAMIVQSQCGFLIAVEEQAALIVMANLILRAITKTGLEY